MLKYSNWELHWQWNGHLDNAMKLSMPRFNYRFFGFTFGQYGFGLIKRHRKFDNV